MKKSNILFLTIIVAFLGMTIASCNNRSQMEKDLDKAAGKVDKAATNTKKDLGL